MNEERTLATGDGIRRLSDDRRFTITFLNRWATVPVFSAKSADASWSGWGGPLSQLVYGETFVMDGSSDE